MVKFALRVACLCLACLLVLLLSGCQRTSTVRKEILTQDYFFDLGVGLNRINHTFVFYLGGNVDSAEFKFKASGLSGIKMEVKSGSGGQVQEITGDAKAKIIGNVAFITFMSAGLVTRPVMPADPSSFFDTSIQIDTIVRWTHAGGPEQETSMGDRVRSLPLSMASQEMSPGMPIGPNMPVELPPSRKDSATYFFTLSGLTPGVPIDFVLDEIGLAFNAGSKLFIADSVTGFTTDDNLALVTDTTGFVTFTPRENQTTLFLAATVARRGFRGFTRFSVNVPRDIVPLTIRFDKWPGQPGAMAGLTAGSIASTLAPILNVASQVLYTATEGHARLGAVRVLTNNTVLPSEQADVIVHAESFPGGPLRQHVYPFLPVEVDAAWFGLTSGSANPDWNGPMDPLTAGRVLTHELMHYRYKLRDEYLDDPQRRTVDRGRLCPNSIMSRMGTVTICWSGNHNPGMHPALTSPSNSDLLAADARLGWSVLNRAPRQLLRNPSFVPMGVPMTVIGP